MFEDGRLKRSEAEAQLEAYVAQADVTKDGHPVYRFPNYPDPFENHERLSLADQLRGRVDLLHIPVMPYSLLQYMDKVRRPGIARLVYAPGCLTEFSIVYHDTSKEEQFLLAEEKEEPVDDGGPWTLVMSPQQIQKRKVFLARYGNKCRL